MGHRTKVGAFGGLKKKKKKKKKTTRELERRGNREKTRLFLTNKGRGSHRWFEEGGGRQQTAGCSSSTPPGVPYKSTQTWHAA